MGSNHDPHKFYCLRAGIPVITPHDCRRTFATKLLENGADVLTVQALMGHSKTDTTKTYDKRPESVKRGVVGLLQVNRKSNKGGASE